MERSIVENKMKNSKPDLYIKPKLENFELLDFHKHEEILKSVDKDVKTFETQLQELMERKQMSAFLKKIIRDK
jgi:predicted acylesterase/phospholipase RssA